MAHLFVYGTLQRGAANHHVLASLGAAFVGAGRTASARTLVDLGPYPALLPLDATRDAAACPVVGEVFTIEEAALGPLDAFEGVPRLYRRDAITVELDGARVSAFTYVFARRVPGRARVVASGRYEGIGTELPDGARPEQVEPSAAGRPA